MSRNQQVAETQQQRPAVLTAPQLKEYLVKHKDSIQSVATKTLDADRVVKIVLTAAMRKPKLLQCDAMSILMSMIRAAELGLEVEGATGEAYLNPYWNSSRGCLEAQFMPGYQGMIKIATRDGICSKVETQIVYDSDPKFDYEYGTKQYLVHKPGERTEKSKPIAAYTMITFPDGTFQFEVMWKSEIDKIKTRAQESRKRRDGSIPDSPWNSDYDEMAKKTTIRRIFKRIPKYKSPALAEAMEHEEVIEKNYGAGEFVLPEDPHIPQKRGTDGLKDKLKDQGKPPVEEPHVDPVTGETDPPPPKEGADLLGDQQGDKKGATKKTSSGAAKAMAQPATAQHLELLRKKITEIGIASEADLLKAMKREKLEGMTQGEMLDAMKWVEAPSDTFPPKS